MSSNDPWKELAIPPDAYTVSARRIDEASRFDFFWGRDSDGRSLLILRHHGAQESPSRLPRLKGIEVLSDPANGGAKGSLVLKLLDGSLRDVFQRLCLDIVVSTSGAATEPEAVSIALSRTWRWHHLLRGGRDGLLSTDEQKGLIGELLVLERYVLTSLEVSDALDAWRGPLGGAKDFIVARTAVESKARSTSDSPQVAVSSEFQLDDSDVDALFLHVSVLNVAPAEGNEGVTITDVAMRLRRHCADVGERVAARLDALLTAAGFAYSDDYAHTRWVSGVHSIYAVAGSFPRLTPIMLPKGTSSVRYAVRLSECASFAVTPADLDKALSKAASAF
jgi:hypothetical protein